MLDLFCGAGGTSAGFHAAGFDVTWVDIRPQPDYPFTFIQADAMTVDLSGYDVIVGGPPCQRYCAATPAHRRDSHPDLVAPFRALLREAVAVPGGPAAYVIENVPGAPLADPVMVCGESLRLGVRRHRLFESNVPLAGVPCWHDRGAPAVAVYGSYGQRTRRKPADLVEGVASHTTEQARTAMGIDWMPWPALTQAIPPAMTHWLGIQLIAWLAANGRDGSDLGDTPPASGNVTHMGETAVHASRVCRCGRPLPPRPGTGRWPRYCSHACRQASYRDRNQIGEAA